MVVMVKLISDHTELTVGKKKRNALVNSSFNFKTVGHESVNFKMHFKCVFIICFAVFIDGKVYG